MPIKAPCQPGQGPEIEINPAIFLESSCLEFVQGHEQMEEYLTQMANEGGYTSLYLTTNSKTKHKVKTSSFCTIVLSFNGLPEY